ncbi:MAG: TorF family putative porin [Alphaproteobacteria bacterium]|jgi:uncharacterized protein (TIGR02001 family)|nr:TorF family putative porin [Alphaproteobacteria bacterium]
MRKILRPVLGLAFLASAAPAFAEDTKPFTVNGTTTLTSDYRFRGISQTNKGIALQGSMTVTHSSGAYASIWGSSIDDYVANGGDEELDLIAGYKTTVGGTTFDMGGLYYYYPGSSTGGKKYYSDFLELYGSVAQTFGPATAKLTANYAPKQKALTLDKAKLDNLYVNVALSSPIPNTPFSLSAAVGHTFTKSFLSGGQRYTDWSLGASYTTGPVTFGLSYVDTSYAKNVLLGRDGRDIAKAGLVGSVGVAF